MALLESSRDISFFGLDEALVLSEDLEEIVQILMDDDSLNFNPSLVTD